MSVYTVETVVIWVVTIVLTVLDYSVIVWVIVHTVYMRMGSGGEKI